MRLLQKDNIQGLKRRDIYGPASDIDLIFHEAACFAMETTQPNTYALYLENKNTADTDYDFRVVTSEKESPEDNYTTFDEQFNEEASEP